MPAFIGAMLGWIFQAIVVKFVVFTAIFLLISLSIPIVLSTILPVGASGDGGLQALFSALPGGIWYFLHWAQIPIGFSILLTAYTTRFIIRRIPFLN